ncbi:MAG TPA: sugar ABC transporter permease [Planctomycetota bacterium]|nr:sugar ABC transporter permease [Planctomycetota bacterium]
MSKPDPAIPPSALPPIPPSRIRTGIVGESAGPLGGWLGFPGLMVLPATILMSMFLFWPALSAFKVALESWTGFAPVSRNVGFDNFDKMWLDKIFWDALQNSVIWMIVGGLGHFFFAFLLATGLQDPELRGKRFYQTLIIFPMFISAIGVAMLWKQLYDPNKGMINLLLATFGLADPIHGTPGWLDPKNGMYPLLLVSIWGGIGGQVILLLAGLRRIPKSLYEAARVDGASEFQCFYRISLPLMRDILKIAFVLWIIGSLQIFGLVQGLLGPGIEPKLHVVSTYMFELAFNNRSNIYSMGQATAMAVTLVFVTLVLVGLLMGSYRLVFGKDKLEY